MRCVPLPSPRKGYVSPMNCTTTPTYSNVCQRSCRKGYELNGYEITTCLASGNWSRNESVSCEGNKKILLILPFILDMSSVVNLPAHPLVACVANVSLLITQSFGNVSVPRRLVPWQILKTLFFPTETNCYI